jgi:Tfp pilus assembly protein PilN
MMKINLLKSRGSSGNTATVRATSTDINYDTAFDAGTLESPRGANAFSKILFMGIFVVGAMIFESFNISQLQSQLSGLTTQKTTLLAEIDEKKPVAEKARTLQKEILDLEAKISGIRGLSKIRLREIKAIDYIQNVIPEKLWLTHLVFDGDQLKIEGASLSDNDLNKFTDSLDGKSYFRNVILLKSVEQKAKEGSLKIFEISSGLTTTE